VKKQRDTSRMEDRRRVTRIPITEEIRQNGKDDECTLLYIDKLYILRNLICLLAVG
jgi:hypothetical protein